MKDAAGGLPIAAALEGFVRRKVIKHTVITTVYGVTRYGARLQIAKQLKGEAERGDKRRGEGESADRRGEEDSGRKTAGMLGGKEAAARHSCS